MSGTVQEARPQYFREIKFEILVMELETENGLGGGAARGREDS